MEFSVTIRGREAWRNRTRRPVLGEPHNYDFWVLNALITEGPLSFDELLPHVTFEGETEDQNIPFLRRSVRRLFEAQLLEES